MRCKSRFKSIGKIEDDSIRHYEKYLKTLRHYICHGARGNS